MNKFVESNVRKLNKLKQERINSANKITQATVKRLNKVISLYKDRKMFNVATAENFIKNLTNNNKRTAEKARDKYNKMIEDLKKKPPPEQKKLMDTYLVNFQLYTTRHPRNIIKPAFKKFGMEFYIEKFDIRQATVKAKDFNKDWIKKVIFRFIDEAGFKSKDAMKVDKEFKEIMDILRQDKDFDKFVKELMEHYDNLFEAIKIQQVEKISKSGEKFDIMKESLTDGIQHVSMYHRYIYTDLNSNLTTLRQAIENSTHIENQCWINSLSDFYRDTLMDYGKRNQLTREKIIEIIGRNDFYSNGASIEEMDKVFKAFKIPARIYNSFNKLIYKHEPEHNKRRIKPFYAIVKNSHIYTINNDLKSIEHKQNEEEERPLVKASTDYHLNEKEEPPEFKMFRDTHDILKMVSKDKEPKTIHLVPDLNNLTEIFFELVNARYEPQIRFQAGIITQIKMKLKKTTFIIKTKNLIKDSSDGCIAVDNEKTYNNMNDAMFHFNKSLFNPLHKSFYNKVDLEIYDEAKTIPPAGLFTDKGSIPKDLTEIDITKAYTSRLVGITQVPVFNQFDVWKNYLKEMDFNTMSDYTLFFVEDCSHCGIVKASTFLMFNKRYNLIYGKYLKQIDTNKLNILYYKTPSFIHEVNYNDYVKELWNKNISDEEELDKLIKKLIVNVNIGLLEKTGSTDQKSIVFKNIREASDFQLRHGGKIHKITEMECRNETTYEGDIENDDFSMQIQTTEEEGLEYYLVNVSDKATLNNGFIYIKELLLQDHNFKMCQDYIKLRKNYIKAVSVKTDAFVIKSEDVEKAKEVLEMKAGIGEWRTNKEGEEIKLPSETYQRKKNELDKIPIYKNTAIKTKDEYDTKNIIEKVISAKQVMIRAKYAGSGKSYICEKMARMGMNVLFVCPTNKLVQKYGKEAVTVNKFFSIAVGDEKLEKFDYSGYDVIVFDEIYFNGLRVLNRIREFVENNQDKIIVATGDGKQLKPVSELTNLQEHEEYADNCVDKIFKYNIYLKVCKRLKKEEDRKKLENIYIDIFENNIKVRELVEKYFKYTSDMNLNENNVAYLNDTCKEVANQIRKKQNRKGEYEVGEVMICREYLKSTEYKFQVNFKYKILNIIENMVVLEDEHDKKIQKLPLDMLRKHFIFNYCYTCHSVQGSSIEGGITIFDYNHCLVDKNWIWTAITRATDLNNVSFYKYDDDDDDFNKNCIYNYLKRKVEGYKEQDRKAKRKIDHKNYITADWLLDRLNGHCELCNVDFYVKSINGNIRTNLTAQRKFNDQTHTISNCIAYCKKCNCCMSDKEKF